MTLYLSTLAAFLIGWYCLRHKRRLEKTKTKKTLKYALANVGTDVFLCFAATGLLFCALQLYAAAFDRYDTTLGSVTAAENRIHGIASALASLKPASSLIAAITVLFVLAAIWAPATMRAFPWFETCARWAKRVAIASTFALGLTFHTGHAEATDEALHARIRLITDGFEGFREAIQEALTQQASIEIADQALLTAPPEYVRSLESEYRALEQLRAVGKEYRTAAGRYTTRQEAIERTLQLKEASPRLEVVPAAQAAKPVRSEVPPSASQRSVETAKQAVPPLSQPEGVLSTPAGKKIIPNFLALVLTHRHVDVLAAAGHNYPVLEALLQALSTLAKDHTANKLTREAEALARRHVESAGDLAISLRTAGRRVAAEVRIAWSGVSPATLSGASRAAEYSVAGVQQAKTQLASFIRTAEADHQARLAAEAARLRKDNARLLAELRVELPAYLRRIAAERGGTTELLPNPAGRELTLEEMQALLRRERPLDSSIGRRNRLPGSGETQLTARAAEELLTKIEAHPDAAHQNRTLLEIKSCIQAKPTDASVSSLAGVAGTVGATGLLYGLRREMLLRQITRPSAPGAGPYGSGGAGQTPYRAPARRPTGGRR